MIKALIIDFSWVLLFPKDPNYDGSLNELHQKLSSNPSYKFFDHFYVNSELLEYLVSIKNQVELYVYTSRVIQETPDLIPHLTPAFREIFSAMRMLTSKRSPDGYRLILEKIGKKPEEVVYVDDEPVNVEAASQVGIHGIVYESNNDLFSKLRVITRKA